jgi:Ca2+-binding RTX toxin-like protein
MDTFSTNTNQNLSNSAVISTSTGSIFDQPFNKNITNASRAADQQPVVYDRQFTGTNGGDFFDGSAFNDQIFTFDGVDVIFASAGNDLINGGDGFDLYRVAIATPIILQATGIINKGALGQDQLVRIEEILAFPGVNNVIDASTSTGTARIEVNLITTTLSVSDVPGIPRPLSFQVKNFVDVIGTANSDSITADDANNFLDGQAGNDSIVAGAGDDIVLGRRGNDILQGDNGNDLIAGTDPLARGQGEIDIVTGGNGRDRFILGDENGAYYRSNGSNDGIRITDFSSEDTIALGSNTLYRAFRTESGFSLFVVENNVLEIVGLVETTQAINIPNDPFRLAPGETFGVFIGSTQNLLREGTNSFDLYSSTVAADRFVTFDGPDTIFGSQGNDFYDGGAGFDAIDYSLLDAPITILPMGMIDKGTLGQDQLVNVERIVGAIGQSNTIDASSVEASTVSIEVNLSGQFFNVFGIPNVPILGRTVENFLNVIGTRNRDSINGNALSNFLDGQAGNDGIFGEAGDDILFGGAGIDFVVGGIGDDWINGTSATARGRNEQDDLLGGAGSDRFVLGDAAGSYYKFNGNNDFVGIRDFNSNDILELGRNETYQISPFTDGFDLFIVTGGRRDLVARVATDDTFNNLPIGSFSLTAGQRISNFIGA